MYGGTSYTFLSWWLSVEIQHSVSVGYEVQTEYVQHHCKYIDTFFDIKKKASVEGNVGLKTVAESSDDDWSSWQMGLKSREAMTHKDCERLCIILQISA